MKSDNFPVAVSALVVLVALSAVTPAVGDAAVGSAADGGAAITGLDPVNVVDADGDGRYSNFDVAVSADTRMPNADPDSFDPEGEPRLKVVVDGDVVDDNIEVRRREDLTGVVRIGPEYLPETGSGDVAVTVVLWDDDTGYGGDVMDRATVSVPYEATEGRTTTERRTTAAQTATTTDAPTTTATRTTSPAETTTVTRTTSSFSLVASRSVTVAGAPVSLRTSGDATLEVVEGPAGSDPALVTHRGGRSVTFRASEPGTYAMRATADSGETATTRIRVEPQSDLLRKYAPVLHYPAGMEYFPTRYEALVHHSDLLRDDGLSDETVDRNPTMFDLANGSDEQYLALDGDEESYPEYDDRYPPTVYASVHRNVAFDGNSYTAVTYWLFYVYDPKAGGLSSLFDHQSDLETVTVLVNESGPQWVGASQHHGGERREWEKASTDGTHVHVYPAFGAHSNYLRDTTKYDGEGLLPQDQYTDEAGGTTEVNDAYSVAYTDRTGDSYTFRPDSGGTERYDLVPLTGNEIWATYDGGFADGPGEGPAPMRRQRWRNPGAWFESAILPDERQVDATIEDATVTPRSNEITVELEVENVGAKPDTFWAVVTANATTGDRTTVARKPIPLGTGAVTNATASVSYPATDADRLDVSVVLLGVEPSVAEPEDLADWTATSVENVGGTANATTARNGTPTTRTETTPVTPRTPTTRTATTGTPTATTPGSATAGTTTRPPTERETETPTAERTTTGPTGGTGTNTSTPGFGLSAGVAGLGLALAALVVRRPG